MNSYIRRLLTRGVKTPTASTVRRPRTRLGVHALEDRITPNVYTVSSNGDTGIGTLRQAITDSVANAGADDIVFDNSFATAKTITLGTVLPQFTAAGGDLTITGPGANLLTVRRDPLAATQFGIFNSLAGNLSLTGFTVAGGNATADGAGLVASGTVRLDGMTFSGNVTSTNGGAIRMNTTGFLDIRNSTITGNRSGGNGAGLYFFSGGSLVMDNTTVSGNTSGGGTGGGGVYFFGTANAAPPTGFTPSTLVIRNSSFTGNTATAGAGGGFVWPSSGGTLQLLNSTISGNTAATSGGGVAITSSTGSVTAVNCTIVGNRANGATATTGGGGIGRVSTGAGTITLQNTVVAGNTNATAADILASSVTTTTANFSAIGNATGFTLTSSANNIASGTALLLGGIGNNGGNGASVAPQPGSPLINAGSNAFASAAGLTTDVRGPGFLRTVGAAVDIGALEVQPVAPTALLATAANVTTAGGTSHTFTITYADDAALNVATIINNNAAVRVTGPNGYSVLATYQSIDVATNGTPRTATYSIPANGGTWDGPDNGLYPIALVGNQIADAGGAFAAAAPVGSFSVSLPRTFVVTNTNDSGAGSLRQAVIDANLNAGVPDTITFDASFSTPKTITLSGGQLTISDPLTLIGPGAALLTVSGGGTSRSFNVNGIGTLDVALSGLTITGGLVSGTTAAGQGGAIYCADENLSLDRVVISGNTATQGGGIAMRSVGTLRLANSTVSGNTSTEDGGGIYFFSGGSFLIQNSTISGNTAGTGVGGGGIYFFGTANATVPAGFTASTLVIQNSTISGNSTGTNGGGIIATTFTGTLLVQNSTITGNSAAGATGGGGIRITAGTLTVQNSVVSGNTNTAAADLSSAATTNVNFSAIGSSTGFTPSGTSGNNLAAGANLLLGPLADNGGPTKTHHPLAGSPLINAGSSALVAAGVTTDQRGGTLDRISGAAVDIGAVEYQPPKVTINQATGQADPTNASPILFTVVFNTPVTGFTAGDIDFTGSAQAASLVAVVSGTGPTYTVSVTGMTQPGLVTAKINAGAAQLSGLDNVASTSTDNNVTFDNEGPMVTVDQAAGQADPTNAAINFTVQFNEPINATTFTPADLSFAGSTAGGSLVGAITPVSGSKYTVTVTGMASSGTVVLSLPASKVADLAGNLNVASSSTDNSVTFDNVAPTITINQASGQADPTNAGPVLFTVVFSEASDPTSFTGSDVSFTGSTAGGTLAAAVTQVNATTYTVSVTGMTTSGTVVASLAAGTVKDFAGNDNVASTSTDNSVTYDTVSPTVTINQAATQLDPANGPIKFTVVFSEAINPATFTGSDVSFTGSTTGGTLVASILLVSGSTYTVTVTGMAAPGNVVATLPAGRVTDLAGNPNTAATFTDNLVGFDNVVPTVTINQAATQPDPTNVEPYHFSVVFSEDVFGFDAADVIIGGTAGATKVEVFPVGASKSQYDVYLSQTTQAGTVIATIGANAATDKAGNGNTASTSTDNTISGDSAPPIVTVSRAAGQADPTSTASVNYTVTFNEPIVGFDASDISFAGSTAGGTLAAALTQAGPLEYTVTVTGMTSDGNVVVSVPAGSVQDLFTNANKVSNASTVKYDTTAPTVTINQAAAQADPTNVASVAFTVTFNEAVTGFTNPLTDVVLSGTAGGTLVATITPVSASTYTVTVTGMTTSGTVVATVPAGAAADLVNLPSAAATSADNVVTYDVSPPDTTITPVPAFVNSSSVTVAFTGTDNVTTPAALTFAYSFDGIAYTATPSPLNLAGLADGAYTVFVRATDAAGNTDPTPATVTFTVDTVAPTVTLASPSTDPTKDNPITVTATFSEDVFTFALADLVLTNATATNLRVVSPSVYTFDVVPLADGPVAVTIPAGVAPDPAGNANSSATLSRVADITAPTVTFTSATTDPTNVSPIHVTATFSERVTSFTQADLQPGNATVANFQAISGTVYEFDLVPTGQGVVSAAVAAGAAPDPAGNDNPAAVFTRVYDTVRPTVTINQAATQADPTNATTVFFTVVFSEPVTGFTAADVVIGGTSGATTATVTGSGATYTVAVGGITQFGTVTATVAAGAAADAAGNPTVAATSTDNAILADPISPLATIAQAAGQRDPATAEPITFTVVFTKPVTGFTLSDLSLAQSTAGGTLAAALTGSGTTYTVAVTGMTTPGTVVLSFPAGAATDSAGNVSRAPTGDATVTYAGEIFAVGSGDGGGPRVDVYNGTGRVLYSFFAFDPSFRGGVHVATGDVTGDGIPDVVVGAGFGGAPHVKVFDGRTGALVASFFAYGDTARGGVHVAVGDVTGDGRPDLITGAGPTGAPHVKVFDGASLAVVQSFFAFPSTFVGGVTVAAGDVTGDGRADIVAGNGTTGEVQVFDGLTLASVRRIAPFFSPVDSQLPLGVNMAVGDVTGDGIADVVIGAGDGGAPQVQVFDGHTGVLSFKNAVFAFDASSRRGVSLAIRDMDGDGVGEILAGDGQTGQVKVFDGDTLAALVSLEPFGTAYVGGVFVG